MSDCCAPKAAGEPASFHCLGCRADGQLVDELTVKALLTAMALRSYAAGRYRFCPTPSCDVVYFSEAGTVFTTKDLRVAVGQKQAAGDRTVCYCFDETESTIAEEMRCSGVSHAVDRVRAHIAAHRCVCEIRNPRGVCCLGDVIAAVERAQPR